MHHLFTMTTAQHSVASDQLQHPTVKVHDSTIKQYRTNFSLSCHNKNYQLFYSLLNNNNIKQYIIGINRMHGSNYKDGN